MTPEELYQTVVGQLKITDIHPLHKAIMEESCENAINNPQKITDRDTLIYATQVSFLTALSALQGTLKGALELGDQVTLNYRNQTFIIPKNSKLLGDA